MSLTPVPAQDGLSYAGRHLAYTRFKPNYWVEWTLFVPNRVPSADRAIFAYQCDVQYAAKQDDFGCWFEGLGENIRVGSTAEFDKWVRGAMADLSHDGTIPAEVTFEYTVKLCDEIRKQLSKLG